LCRKRAFRRWHGLDKYFDYEDIAHIAWVVWFIRCPQIHPYVVTDQIIIGQWRYLKGKCRDCDLCMDIGDHDFRNHDTLPLDDMIAKEELPYLPKCKLRKGKWLRRRT